MPKVFGGYFKCELVSSIDPGASYRLTCQPEELELLTVPCNNRGIFNEKIGDCICYAGYGGFDETLSRHDCSLNVLNWRMVDQDHTAMTEAISGVLAATCAIMLLLGAGPIITGQMMLFVFDLMTDWSTNRLQLRGFFH